MEDTKQPPGGLSDQRETGSAHFGMNPKTGHRAIDPVPSLPSPSLRMKRARQKKNTKSPESASTLSDYPAIIALIIRVCGSNCAEDKIYY